MINGITCQGETVSASQATETASKLICLAKPLFLPAIQLTLCSLPCAAYLVNVTLILIYWLHKKNAMKSLIFVQKTDKYDFWADKARESAKTKTKQPRLP